MTMPDRGTPQRWLDGAWRQLKDFCADGGAATYIWPRWIILRAVGLVYILIFSGIIAESKALVGPDGIAPIHDIIEVMSKQYASSVEAFFRAPSLFWISSSPGMIALLEWLGLASAVALVLNLWPRMALFGCWVIFLSFVVTGHFFSATQPDQLMLEVALLCILLAPPGFRPGLGEKAAPRPLAVFALRWMLIRLMFEAGLAKFIFGGALWRDLTAMDYMYETAPFPTILGYLDYQMPHAYHVLEIALTFAAEIVAPVVAVFGGRRWRWFAFWVWAVFQLGIQLTNNFGWLNVAAIALSVILLDDQMVVGAVRWLRWRKLGDYLAARVAVVSARVVKPWALWGLRVAVGAQFMIAVMLYVIASGVPADRIPSVLYRPVDLLITSFRSANSYPLFSNLMTARDEVEFIGSNDGGETWRTYEFRYQTQRVDRICPFIAPWYPRFEAILQNNLVGARDPTLYEAVAVHLLRRDPALLKLFRRDPFPDRPATMVRMPTFRLAFTDIKTLRATGHYWRKKFQGDFAPIMYVNGHGEIVGGE